MSDLPDAWKPTPPHAGRRYVVGASDIAAIMNADPFRSAVEAHRQRVDNDPFIGNEDTERGQHFEDATCGWYCSKWVANVPLSEVRKQVKLRHPKHDWCVATPDMVLRAVPIQQTEPLLLCVDVKCPRSPSKPVKGGGYEKKWDEGTQTAPLGYRLQSIWQQGVARASGLECEGGELAAGLFFGKLHRVFVPWDGELFELMIERAEEWLSYVKSGQPLPAHFHPQEQPNE